MYGFKICRFKLFPHPFVSKDSELLVDSTSTLKLPNRWMHQDILGIKAGVRKEFMRLVLETSIKPIDAISLVKK